MEIISNHLPSTRPAPCSRNLRRNAWLAAIATCAISASVAHAQLYSVKDAGVVPRSGPNNALGLNDAAQLIGTVSSGADARAFRFEGAGNAERKEIGDPGSRALSINANGLVAGDAMVKGGFSQAALFKDGLAALLGTVRGTLYSRANGLNYQNDVVGSSGNSFDGECTRAFYYSDATGMLDIGTLGGPYAQATAINDNRVITGSSQVKSRIVGATHAFLVQAPTGVGKFTIPMTDLGTLGGPSSYGLAINQNNHVVGYSTLTVFDDRYHGFFFNGSKMEDLGSLSPRNSRGDFSVAAGMNNLDQVVGYTYASPASNAGTFAEANVEQVAFIYTPDGGMQNLNNLIGVYAEKFHLVAANAINDKGQIAAEGYDAYGEMHALLLSPEVVTLPPIAKVD